MKAAELKNRQKFLFYKDKSYKRNSVFSPPVQSKSDSEFKHYETIPESFIFNFLINKIE